MNQLQSWSFTQSNICKTSFVPTIFLTPIPVHPRNWDHFICSWIKQKLFDFLSIRLNQFMTRNLSEDEKKNWVNVIIFSCDFCWLQKFVPKLNSLMPNWTVHLGRIDGCDISDSKFECCILGNISFWRQ